MNVYYECFCQCHSQKQSNHINGPCCFNPGKPIRFKRAGGSLVFLDIDGVLNTSEHYDKFREIHRDRDVICTGTGTCYHDYLLIDEKMVGFLNLITESTNASIVISSDWRYFYKLKYVSLIHLLARIGVKAPIIGSTPESNGGVGRGEEILAWLRLNPVDEASVVVLDDNDKGMDAVRQWFVKTDPNLGLDEFDSSDAISRLYDLSNLWKRQ